MGKILIGASAAALTAVVAISFADLKRYLRIRSM